MNEEQFKNELTATFPLIFDEVYRFVRVRVPHMQDAEDIVSRTVETMMRRSGSYNVTQGNLAAWATGIAKRHILHYWRDRRPLEDLVEAEKVVGTFEFDTANNALDWERLATSLTDEQRALLLLRYVDGYTSDEIASKFGKTGASIRKQLSRLRTMLRKNNPTL